MHQQVKDKLHYYIPYDLKITNGAYDKFMSWANYSGIIRLNQELRHIPYMRPLSSLDKEIMVDGYNEGKPFYPLEELKEVYNQQTIGELTPYIQYHNADMFTLFATDEYSLEVAVPFCIYELLFRWHFWLWDQSLFESGDIIEIKD